MTAEEWRPVVGFPDYMVSSSGRVMSYRRKKPREIEGALSDNGYAYIWLCSDSGTVKRATHRVIAEAFYGPCPEGMEVRHLDGQKANLAAANLAYGTHSQNMLDQVAHGTHITGSRTKCRQGHPYDEVNTYIWQGKRFCRECQRSYRRRRRAAQ